MWTPAICPGPQVWCRVDCSFCHSWRVPAGGGQLRSFGAGCTATLSYPQSCPQVWVDRLPVVFDVSLPGAVHAVPQLRAHRGARSTRRSVRRLATRSTVRDGWPPAHAGRSERPRLGGHADTRSHRSGDPGTGGGCAAGVGWSSVPGDRARRFAGARVMPICAELREAWLLAFEGQWISRDRFEFGDSAAS